MHSGRLVSVVIIDDDSDYREFLKFWISQEQSLRCIAEFAAGNAAIPLLLRQHPTLALVDVRLPHSSGPSVIKRIKVAVPTTRVVAITSYTEWSTVMDALIAGADGVAFKTDYFGRMNDFVTALKNAATGAPLLSDAVRTLMIHELQQWATAAQKDTLGHLLSRREHDVVQCWREGLGDKQIADRLGIAQNTVNTYHKHIFRKLSVHSKMQATARLFWGM